MNNSASCKTDPFAIGIGIVLCIFSLPLFWAALELPGVTGSSGSVWERGMLASFWLTALCFGLMMVRVGMADREKWRTPFTILALGGCFSLGIALWTTYERAKEVGMILPF